VSWTRRSRRRTGKPTWLDEEDERKLVAVLGTGRAPKVALRAGRPRGRPRRGSNPQVTQTPSSAHRRTGHASTEHHRGADQNQNGEGGNGDLPLEISDHPVYFAPPIAGSNACRVAFCRGQPTRLRSNRDPPRRAALARRPRVGARSLRLGCGASIERRASRRPLVAAGRLSDRVVPMGARNGL
jgi:hypothetical protein